MTTPRTSLAETNVLREVIAGIVDPAAKFQDIEGVSWSRFELEQRELAYRKADSILSLMPAALPPESKGGMVKPTLMGPISSEQRISSECEEMLECGTAEAFEEADFATLYREVNESGTTTLQEITNVPQVWCREIARHLKNLSAEPVASDDASKLVYPESPSNSGAGE